MKTRKISKKKYAGNDRIVHFKVHGYVTEIEDEAFKNCKNLEKVTIPDGVTEIGEDAFRGCRSLTSVTIPSSVKHIGKNAFSGCEKLVDVNISSNVAYIEEGTFKDCTNLTEITIPDGVISIGEDAFSGCYRLSKVNFPSTLESIGDGAFIGCKLTEIAIPSSVKKITKSSFDYTYYDRYRKDVSISIVPVAGCDIDIDKRFAEIRDIADGLDCVHTTLIFVALHRILGDFSFSPLLTKRLCDASHAGKLDEEIEKVEKVYKQVGFLDVRTEVDTSVKVQLKELFLQDENCHGHVPKMLDTLVIASKNLHIEPEEIVQKFEDKKFRDAIVTMLNSKEIKFSEIEAFLLAMVLTGSQVQSIIKNPYKDYASALLYDSFKSQDDDTKKKLLDAAKWLIFHPGVKAETVKKVYGYEGLITITPDMTADEVRKQYMMHEADLEIEKIEKEYEKSGVKFDECECVLPKTEVECDGLKAYILDAQDKRQVMLGYDTACCQHLRGAGESAMMYGLINPKAGFWVIEDKKTGKILAQAEVWQRAKEKLVFDNIEFADDRQIEQFAPVIGMWCKASPYKHIFMGDGYNELNSEEFRHVKGIYPPLDGRTAYYLDDGDTMSYDEDIWDASTCDEKIEWYKEALKRRKVKRDDLLYTDADESCSVLKMDGKIEPYFQKALDRLNDSAKKRGI